MHECVIPKFRIRTKGLIWQIECASSVDSFFELFSDSCVCTRSLCWPLFKRQLTNFLSSTQVFQNFSTSSVFIRWTSSDIVSWEVSIGYCQKFISIVSFNWEFLPKVSTEFQRSFDRASTEFRQSFLFVSALWWIVMRSDDLLNRKFWLEPRNLSLFEWTTRWVHFLCKLLNADIVEINRRTFDLGLDYHNSHWLIHQVDCKRLCILESAYGCLAWRRILDEKWNQVKSKLTICSAKALITLHRLPVLLDIVWGF